MRKRKFKTKKELSYNITYVKSTSFPKNTYGNMFNKKGSVKETEQFIKKMRKMMKDRG